MRKNHKTEFFLPLCESAKITFFFFMAPSSTSAYGSSSLVVKRTFFFFFCFKSLYLSAKK